MITKIFKCDFCGEKYKDADLTMSCPPGWVGSGLQSVHRHKEGIVTDYISKEINACEKCADIALKKVKEFLDGIK